MLCNATVRGAAREATASGRRVLRMRYGIGCPPRTLDDVAGHLKISRDRVRRLEARGLALLGRRPEVARSPLAVVSKDVFVLRVRRRIGLVRSPETGWVRESRLACASSRATRDLQSKAHA